MGEKPASDQERYEALRLQLAQIDLIRRGSLVRRMMPCGKEGCRCQAKPPALHGPYYQWTRKEGGKTVTRRVSRAEADLLRTWIANGRQLSKVVAQLERCAYRITQRLLREAGDT